MKMFLLKKGVLDNWLKIYHSSQLLLQGLPKNPNYQCLTNCGESRYRLEIHSRGEP